MNVLEHVGGVADEIWGSFDLSRMITELNSMYSELNEFHNSKFYI